jgi:hypothetical protein
MPFYEGVDWSNNNTSDTAHLFNQGNYTGIHGIGQDWYAFDTGPGNVTLTMTPQGGIDVNMTVYNSSLQAIMGNHLPGTQAESAAFWSVASSRYYVHITSALNNNLYDLSIDTPDHSWSRTLPFGPIQDSSIAVYDIDNDGVDEIFVGTRKTLDAQANEIRPAGFVCLEPDGTVKWSISFPALSTPDPVTGKMYSTSAIGGAPLFTDVDGDGVIDIVVGTGGDLGGEYGNIGQPGDRGGIYAITGTGQIKWFHENAGFPAGDTRRTGTYSSPIAFDIDADGVREIIYAGWDQHLMILDGRTGQVEQSVDFLDTILATPRVADLNNDGTYEIIMPADVSATPGTGVTQTGGILHVLTNYLNQEVPGWNSQIQSTVDPALRGRFDAQTLWASPITADLDGNGTLEIIQGTGTYDATAGQYIKIWNADGTLRATLATNGRTFATPLVADLDGNGSFEIVAATVDGYVHAWSNTGAVLFSTAVRAYNAPTGSNQPIYSSPLGVDMNNDGRLEIIVQSSPQTMILNSINGQPINSTATPSFIHTNTLGAPAVHDIDHDGLLDIISGGRTQAGDQAVVFRWDNVYSGVTSTNYRDGRYQFHQSLSSVDGFVERFYQDILGRGSDAAGSNYWVDVLSTGVKAGAEVARDFVFSQEFINQNNSNTVFINRLYESFFDRAPDTGGFNHWMSQLNSGVSRSTALDGFIYSQEFSNLSASFGIRPALSYGPNSGPGDNTLIGTARADVLNGGAGNDNILGDGATMQEATQYTNGPNYSIVFRLYAATFGREPDPVGWSAWVDQLNLGVTPTSASQSFISSGEFQSKYGSLNNSQFVTQLYRNVLGREPDSGGLGSWVAALNGGQSRASVLIGFSESQEHINRTDVAMHNFMFDRNRDWNDIIEGGAGNDTVAGGRGSDIYVFRRGEGGNDHVNGFEHWDQLQFSHFGYSTRANVLAHMTQQGADVVFTDQGQTITFHGVKLADMNKVRFNLS